MYVGQRLSYNGELCSIRYIGEVEGTKGEWLGVEWDDPTRGKHNGEAGGRRYFQCISKETKVASFIRPTRPADKERTFIEALRFKYASEHIKISFQIGQPHPDKTIRISGKEVEEIGFDKIRKQLADLHELRVVLLDGLCIRQPVNEALLQIWQSRPSISRQRTKSDIHEICPKITELDLSNNLFATFDEVAAICEQLDNLKMLRLDGNRLRQVQIYPTQEAHFKLIFARVESLALENTLLKWEEVVAICACFPALKTLSISSNEFDQLDTGVPLDDFPPVTTIKLESNRFKSLYDISALARLPDLRHIILKYNTISSITNLENQTVFPNITDLDMSYNDITSWTSINDLAATCPALTSLRISHNPLFSDLHSPAGRELTADDGYMLTIARLPHLKVLNFSAITAKDRLNAESYYLSLIVQELSLAPEAEAGRIKAKHPRWEELCAEYGEPEVKREKDHVDPRSLGSRLLTLEFELSGSTAALFKSDAKTKAVVKCVPKRFNVYSALGMMAKAFGQSQVAPGLSLSLITDDWEEVNGERVRREIKLVPETRGIGTFVEERVGHIRVDYEEPVREYGAYEHPVVSSLQQESIVT